MLLRACFSVLLMLACLGCASTSRPSPTPQAPPSQSSAEQSPRFSKQTGPLRIGIIGLTHDHVHGLLWNASRRDDITIVGIAEPNRELFDRFAARYQLDPSLYHASTAEMIDATHPEAVSVMGSIREHVDAVAACAPHGVHLLIEKPLTFSRADASRIESLARDNRVLVLTNFETSWYASVREARRLVDSGELSPLRRMNVRVGHRGPQEIGCSPDFLAWLTDPDLNGGGAVVDFGCYGAVLSTWMMHGQRPTSVTARASTLKPAIYPRVDDDATIVLTYPTATTVIEASWCWTHDNKEMDLYTDRASIHAAKWDALSIRQPDKPATEVKPPAKPEHLSDEWTYLRKVVRGECEVDPLSSLEYNLIVAEILDDARRVARGERE